MLQAGKSQREIAIFFGVTPGAVCQVKKELNINVIKSVALENAHRVVEKNLDAVEQLQKINDHANSLLDRAMMVVRGESAADPQVNEPSQDIALKAMKEIRGQLALQLDIFKTLYDMNAVAEFQKEVLDAIGEADPETRNKIIYGLQSRRAVRSTFDFPR